MKLGSSLFAVAGAAIGAIITITVVGCHNEISFIRDPYTQELTPVVKTGDVITWDVAIDFRSGGSGPCDPAIFTSSGKKRCVVTDSRPILYTYRCQAGEYCDPDIAVDDDFKPFGPTTVVRTLMTGGGSQSAAPPGGAGATADDPTEPYVYLECREGRITADPMAKNDRKVGEVVQWRSTGPYKLQDGWKVIPDDAALCRSGRTELGPADQCILAGTAGTAYPYNVTAGGGCSMPTKGTVTPQTP